LSARRNSKKRSSNLLAFLFAPLEIGGFIEEVSSRKVEPMREVFEADIQTTFEILELRLQKKTQALKSSVSRQP